MEIDTVPIRSVALNHLVSELICLAHRGGETVSAISRATGAAPYNIERAVHLDRTYSRWVPEADPSYSVAALERKSIQRVMLRQEAEKVLRKGLAAIQGEIVIAAHLGGVSNDKIAEATKLTVKRVAGQVRSWNVQKVSYLNRRSQMSTTSIDDDLGEYRGHWITDELDGPQRLGVWIGGH
jgi:hypothetical protein